jgi:hypothetical protein
MIIDQQVRNLMSGRTRGDTSILGIDTYIYLCIIHLTATGSISFTSPITSDSLSVHLPDMATYDPGRTQPVATADDPLPGAIITFLTHFSNHHLNDPIRQIYEHLVQISGGIPIPLHFCRSVIMLLRFRFFVPP